MNGHRAHGFSSVHFLDSDEIIAELNLNGNVYTAINGVFSDVNGEVVGVEYVNSLGVVSKRPFSGINIVVTRYSDGSATTVKKVFK